MVNKTATFIIVSIFMVALVSTASAAWWNVSWNYKTESILTNVPSGGYQYNLTVHSASGTNNQTDVFLDGYNATNFTDIRFILDDITELAYWIEDNSTDPIKVWINVTGNGIVDLYYGYSSASSNSNIANAFFYGDDFEDADLSRYTTTGTPTEVSGYLSLDNGDGISIDTSLPNNILIYAETWHTTGGSVPNGNLEIRIFRENASEYWIAYTPENYGVCQWTGGGPGNMYIHSTFDFSGATWYESRIRRNTSGGWRQQYNTVGSAVGSLWDNEFTDTWLSAHNSVEIYSTRSVEQRVRLIYIRKYVSPEPSWSIWSIKQSISSPLEYNTQRKLTRTSEGYLHQTYTKWDGSNYRVYYAKSADNGNNWDETVLTDAGTNNTHPSIAGNSEDNLWVVYSKESSGIRYRKYVGTKWQSEQTISTDNGEVPVITINSTDGIHIVWFANLSDTYQIRYYNGSTTTITTGSKDHKYPSLAIDSNNYLHVAYQKWNSTSNTWNIKYQKYTNSWQDVCNITTGETYYQEYPCIVVDLSNYVHITWQTDNHKIKYKKYTTTWQSTEEVCDGGVYRQYNPSISVYSTNYVYVTWFGVTATYPDNWIIRERHKTGSWSAISDILHPISKDVIYPNSISALYPKICSNCYLNIPLTGFSFVYDEDGTIKYYNASTWRCPDSYILTVTAKSSTTNQIITNFTAELSTGETKTADSGVVKFRCLETGYYEVTISSNEYHPAQQSIVLDQNKEIIVYLVPISETEYFLPDKEKVEFRVQNIYGNPISDVSVTAFGIETTMGAWDWLSSFFGVKNETVINDTTMSGTTDDTGTLTFMMFPTIKYNITFTKASENINETLFIYPKESQYLIILTPTTQPMMINYVEWNLSVEEIFGDSANRSLNFTYTDNMSKTSKICFFVKDENKTEIHSTCSFPDNSSVNTGYTVAKSSGVSYFWGFNATHTTFGGIKGTKAVTFKSRLIDLQLKNENYYSWISIALLVMITSLFSAITTKFGYIVIPFIASFFTYIGWLEISVTLITVIVILGILLYIGKKERESGL